ncbi:bile acid:sodium symporter family protein [Rariglobus hedericola]|uniref:Bile acid:sodium symporter n=1 Tax=Rariglobus hedericola TaxID=2597822 RepID=A0A556QQ05_9BACT|nr:bile acid:sodium symporter family protein [Rariglobus hedericola]TSJ78720.1 bile acid:sodium symporter [Rariglobus hedericola]
MRLKFDWFLVGMAVAVALAWVFPAAGAPGGWLHPELVNKLGVAVIFFLNGVSLSFVAMKAGASRWPVHIVVQSTTYVIFPLVGMLMMLVPSQWMAPELAIGFFYLCVVPSTVSSSVVMTAAARGNVPVAVFNATLSSVIGIFVTPLLIGWWLHTDGAGIPLGKVILDLLLWLLLPLALGQACRPWLKEWAVKNKKLINKIDRSTILFIIYTSFCDSIVRGVWSGKSEAVITAVLGSVVLFYVVFYAVSAISKTAGFNAPDRIAAIFCGSKKSIAAGVPMAQLIFAGDPRLGLILLPLMIYHPLQLVICGVLAGRWERRTGDDLRETA